MGGLSWWHWLVIGGAFILLFGAKKLPDAARGVGRSLRILKSEVTAMSEDGGTDGGHRGVDRGQVGAPVSSAADVTSIDAAARPAPTGAPVAS